VIFTEKDSQKKELEVSFYDGQAVRFKIQGMCLDSALKASDFVRLDVTTQSTFLIDNRVLALMRQGVGIVNNCLVSVRDEASNVEALDAGQLSFAGLVVFEAEPRPAVKVLMNPKTSLSPHIGASTLEAQGRIGEELASQVIELLH